MSRPIQEKSCYFIRGNLYGHSLLLPGTDAYLFAPDSALIVYLISALKATVLEGYPPPSKIEHETSGYRAAYVDEKYNRTHKAAVYWGADLYWGELE